MAPPPRIVTHIAATLEERINGGFYTGDLPIRKELAKEFKTSAESANKAVMLLQAKGLVTPRGRTVMPTPVKFKVPGVVPDFGQFLRDNGLIAVMKDVHAPTLVPLGATDAREFSLPANTPVIKRTRLQGERRENKRIWYRLAETYYLDEIAHHYLEDMSKDTHFNVTEAIKKETGEIITHCTSRLKMRYPEEEEWELLNITYQTPIIEHYRMNYGDRGTLLMFNRLICVANRFEFTFDYPMQNM